MPALGRLRQVYRKLKQKKKHELKASLGYIVRPCGKINK
jgi:hypothetical protein